MLQEDSSVTERRAAVRNLYDKIKMAIDDVQYKQEKVKRKDHEGDTVRAPAGASYAHLAADYMLCVVLGRLACFARMCHCRLACQCYCSAAHAVSVI